MVLALLVSITASAQNTKKTRKLEPLRRDLEIQSAPPRRRARKRRSRRGHRRCRLQLSQARQPRRQAGERAKRCLSLNPLRLEGKNHDVHPLRSRKRRSHQRQPPEPRPPHPAWSRFQSSRCLSLDTRQGFLLAEFRI